MSVVIKGMTMPKDCGECKICYYSAVALIPHYFCGVTHNRADPWKYGAFTGKRPGWCPLTEVDDDVIQV